MRRLVLATRNRHKVREFDDLARPLGYEVLRLVDLLPDAREVREDGDTFLANAVLKATDAWRRTGLPAVADDSGICVHHLNNAPGINSARWSLGGDPANNQKLLQSLAGVPDSDRGAHYHCALALVANRSWFKPGAPLHAWGPLSDSAGLLAVSGQLHGRITHAPAGSGGFGYDPLFWVEGLGCTLAEVSAAKKHHISHRGKAFRALSTLISEWAR